MRDMRTYTIIGEAMGVHSALGPGLPEAVYEEALERRLRRRGVSVQRQVAIPIVFEGERLARCVFADMVCFADLPVELKAHDRVQRDDVRQLVRYMEWMDVRVGLLFCIGGTSLQWYRASRAQETGSGAADVV